MLVLFVGMLLDRISKLLYLYAGKVIIEMHKSQLLSYF